MIQVGDRTQIDTSLITCAEYQLFLTGQKTINGSSRPDHWQREEFILGTGRTPVPGLRSSDALAFCLWLTKHYAGIWHYRLPTSSEIVFLEKGRHLSIELASESGIWTDNGKNFTWIGNKQPPPDQGLAEFKALLLRNNVVFDTEMLKQAYNNVRFVDIEVAWDQLKNMELASLLDPIIRHAEVLQYARFYDSKFARQLIGEATEHRQNLITHTRTLQNYMKPVVARFEDYELYPLLQEIDSLIRLFTQFKDIDIDGHISISHAYRLCYTLIAGLLIIKLRRDGNLPAREGLLIAREQL